MNKEFESTKSKFKPIGFSMKDDRVSLKAELCDDEENRWKLDIAQPQQVCKCVYVHVLEIPVYVCMYVCMYACMYVCINAC